MKHVPKPAPETQCPFCGEEVAPNALGCRRCGSMKAEKGWTTPEFMEGYRPEIEDDDFDYDEFLMKEFGQLKARQGESLWKRLDKRKAFWWVVALLTLIAFIRLSLGF